MANIGASCEKVAVTQTQVSEQLGILEDSIEALNQSVDRINNKVADTLRQEPPIGVNAKEPNALVPLAERIRKASNKIRNITDAINSISDRCEL